MENKKEMTVLNTSVGADDRQSKPSIIDTIIAEADKNSNSSTEIDVENLEDINQELLRQLNKNYLRTVTMSTLYNTVFDNTQTPLIEGLLQRGTYLFVGSPKVGKSFMMAQLAYHVSTGKKLWGYKVRKATVLYFALEDDYPRLQRRMFQMFGENDTENLHFATECKTLNGGLEEQISGFIGKHPDTGLIIIDTLKRVREAGGADYSYGSDYDVVARLKALADSYRITMLIVHHTRKQKADDVFDTISGTNGLMGAADGAFLLSKDKRTSNSATLDISGRDQQDMKLHLVRDTEKLVWNFESSETELWVEPLDPVIEKVKDALDNIADGKWSGSPTELVELIGEDIKPNVLTLKLNINVGKLYNEFGIKYDNRRSHNGRIITLINEKRDDA